MSPQPKKKKKRILMISDHSDPLGKIGDEQTGGQNVYVRELSDHLIKNGHEVFVITRLDHPRRKKIETSKNGFKVVRIKAGPIKFIPKEDILKYFEEFLENTQKFIQSQNLKFDIIHSHYWISGILGLALKEKLKTKLIHTFHSLGKIKHKSIGIKSPKALEREHNEKKIINNVDQIIATCPEEKKQLIKLYQASPQKITLIPVGVNLRRFSYKGKNKSRRKLNLNPHKTILLFVGRIVPQKGLPTLIKAFDILLKKIDQETKEKLKLIIIGGNSSGGIKKINKIISEYNLNNNIKLEGMVLNKDLPWYYSSADIGIVPSRYEPFGIVPLEASACRLPVVVSHTGGLKFSIKDNETGLHAKTNDPADFSEKILYLLQNPKIRRKFGRNGEKRIREHFNWEKISNQILQTYQQFF